MTEPTREPTFRGPTFSENFFEDTEMSGYKDVKIILSEEPMRPWYHLHKVILAGQSSFFRKLFYHEPKDVYEIGAVSKGGFEAIIDIMYGQTLTYDMSDNRDRTDFSIIVDTCFYLGCRPIWEEFWAAYTLIGINSR